MDNFPKIGMVNFDLKICNLDSTDFAEKISNYILAHYQENPESYINEINEILKIRENAASASKDFMGLNLLKKYYKQLQFISNRFPMKSGEECESEFSWDHLYNDKEIVHTDIRFEQQSILYNIGALHSYLGSLDKRTNEDGIKISCTHFQYAAWAFQIIRDNFSILDFSSDLNEDIMTFKMNLMLAQAQECVLEKSIIDNRKASINAKISVQIIDYLRIALTNCEKQEFQSNIGSKQSKEMKQLCLFKIAYYSALVNYFSALNSVELKKIGESVGYIQLAEAKIAECAKLKYKEFQEALKVTTEIVENKSKALKKENDFVYNEKIVSSENLPEVKGVSLVKPLIIDFEKDPEIACQDIFSRLVSMKAHELSSLYSEEKAKIMRQINTQVDDKNAQLEQFLAALQINQLHLNDLDYLKLPKQLLECCASVSSKSNSIKQELAQVMKKIVDVSIQSKGVLEDIEDLLEEENKEYKQHNPQIDSSESDSSDSEPEPTNERKRKLRELLNRYDSLSKSHNDANTSNSALRDAFNSVLINLQLLNLPLAELSEKLPKIEPINNEESKVIRDKLLTLLAKVDEMKTQRVQLLNRLQRAIQEDDLTRTIASHQNEIKDEKEFFQEQLKKHEQLLTYLQQNLQAQDNILRALADANASFASDRKKILDATQERNAFIDNLVFSFQSINELCDKANKGIGFFEKLNEPLKQLFNDVKEFCTKQKLEKEKKVKQHINPRLIPPSPPKPVSNDFPTVDNDLSALMSSMNTGDRPKLKDFLPFMKPQTWGANSKSKGHPALNRANYIPGNQLAQPVPVPQQIIPNAPPFPPQTTQLNYPPAHQMIPAQVNFQNQQASFEEQRLKQLEQQQKYFEHQRLLEEQRLKQIEQQKYYEQQRILEEQKLKQQEMEKLKLQQEKLLEQKMLEQQMKEKEIEMRRIQLEQQEQQLKLLQQQLLIQQQQKPQNFYPIQQANVPYQIPNPILPSQIVPTIIPTLPVQQIQSKPTETEKPKPPESNLNNNQLLPDSVYKPGYLNQIKFPTDLTQNFIQPPIVQSPPQVFNTNFRPTLPVVAQQTINAPQVPTTIQQTTQPPKTAPAPVTKPSAIDDLLDLFDGSNLNTSSPVLPLLQPVKIETSLILAQKKDESKPAETYPSPKNPAPIKQEEINPIILSPSESITSIASNSSSSTSLNSNKKLNFLNNQSKQDRFLNEVNKFEHHVNSLTNKTLSTSTILENEWKELNDYQDKHSSQMTISIARLNPSKNRFQDLLPYDQTRVCLKSKKGADDYINATLIGQLAQDLDPNSNNKQPSFIITQMPFTNLQNELFDFWSMILQEQIEVLVCLCRDSEFGTTYYWPNNKQTPLNILNLKICLQSSKETLNSTQRVFTVSNLTENVTRTVVILQYQFNSNNNGVKPVIGSVTGIAQNEMPENISSFLKFVKECEYFYLKEQRNKSHPILVHCMNGVSRSAVFILLYSMIQLIDSICESDSPYQISLNSDLVLKLIKQMRSKRKYMIQSMHLLKYSYDAILYYLKDTLIKEGILTVGFDRKQSIELDSSIIKDESVSSIQSIAKDKIFTNQTGVENSQLSPKSNGKDAIKSIVELEDPNKFSLDLKEENVKRKISKKDFLTPGNGHSNLIDPNDPFNWLDPLKK